MTRVDASAGGMAVQK